jgi:nucleotide-binding universal stress UspA family protein
MDDLPILICYDGSDGAKRAIRAAADLFQQRRAVVLDIGPPLTAAESLAVTAPVSPAAEFEGLNEDDARRRARAGADEARQAGFESTARTELAAPTWQGVVDVADEIDAAVIVLGSRGLAGAREFLVGSVSHEVAEHAGRPVLIVPPPHERPRDRGDDAEPILICYDGSEGARRAIVVAGWLLRQRDSVVLNVGPIEMVADEYAALDPDAMRVDQLAEEEALSRATAGAELAREAGFRAQARSDVDSPTWSGVVEIADDVNAAVVVIGSRGLSGWKERAEGSVSHQVAEYAGRPVLIVPPRHRTR